MSDWAEVNPVTLAKLMAFPERAAKAFSRRPNPTPKQLIQMCRSLLSERGEVSGVHIATAVLLGYQTLDAQERHGFFDALVRNFSPDPEQVGRSADAYRENPSAGNLAELQRAIEAPRRELFRRLNTAPDGTRTLVAMRKHVLREIASHPDWAFLEADLGHLLTSWFNRGFLSLRRIDWNTPANILEKLIQYEAVHAIQGWKDLHRRLQADRSCFAFFHPALPDEPVVFIEVALTRGMSARIQPLLDPDSAVSDPQSADCAMFYSITNCQEGLRGVPFGSFLIKKVVEDVSKELPGVKTFATLSPVPGFCTWLNREGTQWETGSSLLRELQQPSWWEDKSAASRLNHQLEILCAHYLMNAKQGQEPLDSVARFHLRNGARLERINFLADTSSTGMQRSAGLMVNYVYRSGDLERNHEAYTNDYKVMSAHHISWLAKQAL